MPCCHIPNPAAQVFPPSLIHDAERFAKYVGGAPVATIGLPTPTADLTSALHLEMKLWNTRKRLPTPPFHINDAQGNSWTAMRGRGHSTFDQNEKNVIFAGLNLVRGKNFCCLCDYDGWILGNIIHLRSMGILAHRHPDVPPATHPSALATVGRCQKLINVFVKYEICWQVSGYWNARAFVHYALPLMPQLPNFLCALHAPIDSIFLKAFLKKSLGRYLKKIGLLVNHLGSPKLIQSSNGNPRTWSQLDCPRTYYGFQLMLRRVAMQTWKPGCACDGSAKDAICRCANWFESQFGKEHPNSAGQPDWVQAACNLPSDVIGQTIEELRGDTQKNSSPVKSVSESKAQTSKSQDSDQSISHGKPEPIFLNEFDNNGKVHKHALRIVINCEGRWNLGAICKKHNCLDLQDKNCRGGRYLIGEIAARGGNFPRETPRCRVPGVCPNGVRPPGQTCCWGGSAYEAGVHFDSPEAAVRYLKKYFEIRACKHNPTYNQSWINGC